MEVVEVRLKVLTPMFSFGDQSKAEFRITELKALMRSTFRELYYFKDLEDMKSKEGYLFGDMGRKSPIAFRIRNIQAGDKEKCYLLPHRTEEMKRGRISCLIESKMVTFSMLINSKENLDFYIELLIFSSILGSMGKRSRKGFGSFKVEEIKINGINKYEALLNQDLMKYWEKLQKDKEFKIRNATVKPSTKGKISINFNKYNKDMNFPYLDKIIFLSSEEFDYDYLLNKISDLTHKRLYKEFIEDKNNSIDKRILGNFIGGNNDKKLDRFASPIYITFSEYNNKNYLVIKELNYNYILEKLKIYENNENYNANKEYVGKFINDIESIFERMKKIKKGER